MWLRKWKRWYFLKNSFSQISSKEVQFTSMYIESQPFAIPDTKIESQNQSSKQEIFLVSSEELRDRFGWGKINMPKPYQNIDYDNHPPIDYLNCRFPLECELSLDSQTQKVMLTISLKRNDKENNRYYTLDIGSITLDLVSMGYLEESDIPKFIYEMTVSNPDPKSINYLDSEGATINGFVGRFELEACDETKKDVCVLVRDSETEEVIAKIPFYPTNEFEWSLRQRNVEIYDYPSDEAKDYVETSAFVSIACLMVIAGSMSSIRYYLEKFEEKRRSQ